MLEIVSIPYGFDALLEATASAPEVMYKRSYTKLTDFAILEHRSEQWLHVTISDFDRMQMVCWLRAALG